MATGTASAARGLSTEDLKSIRATLAAGRRPRVAFTEAAGQVAGQVGQVVGLTDPELSEEWLVVRFGRDELPFSPADLTLPRRAAAARRAPSGPPAGSGPAAGRSEIARQRPVPSAHRETSAPEMSTVDAEDAPAPNGRARPARRPAGRGPKGKAPAALSVTLAYAEGEWTVAAQQGSRTLVRPYLVKPAEALKIVALLDVPGVHEAVEHILAAERTSAEQQAERLRAQLAEVEARLAELRSAG